MNNGKTARRAVGVAVVSMLVLVASPSGWPEWIGLDKPVPLERLLKNAGRYVEKNPKEARGYYVLGRLHSLAFAKKAEAVAVRLKPEEREKEGPILPEGFAPWETIMVKRERDEEELTEQIKNHLKESIKCYRKAVELDSEDALVFLGLGWVLEEAEKLGISVEDKNRKELSAEEQKKYEELIEKLGASALKERDKAMEEFRTDMPRTLSILSKAQDHKNPEIRTRVKQLTEQYRLSKTALTAYRRAYALALEVDLARGHLGLQADAAVSLEAGHGILRILGKGSPSKEEQEELARVQKSIDAFNEKGKAITPIIFPLDGRKTLKKLLSKNTRVKFDLDGFGEPRLWPWVKSETGILVWDPYRKGKITSGIQLFGSVTWWIFWDHGYQPLALLDDDDDGRLAGTELEGLAVWQDRNGNGVSEPGEVIPVGAVGVVSIAVRPSGTHDGVPGHSRGISFRNGLECPTYDWTPVSVPESALPVR